MNKDIAWLLRENSTRPKLRLFCFAYAGGSATMYLPWQAELGPHIEVCAIQLPGRAGRYSEKPFTDISELSETVARVIGANSDLPFAFFGHSLGGLIAFEVARVFQRQNQAMPAALFVSGCAAPQLRPAPRHLHLLNDVDLVAQLARYGGTPPAVLEHRELMSLLLPAIRADFTMVETYRYQAGPPLDLPITVFAGTDDPFVSAAAAQAWARESRQAVDLVWLEGDHFFIRRHERGICQALRGKLDGLTQ
jgi:medium-chain acyl-[acyl-carrier-protein] hydrolase